MRFTLPLLALVCTLNCAAPAHAQTAPEQAQKQAPAAIDWATIGKPLDNDTKDMMDRYVYFDQDATDKTVALDNPVLGPDSLYAWVEDNLTAALTLNGNAYDTQTIANRRYFTPLGYADYITTLRHSKIDSYLKDNKYRLSAVILDHPTITAKGLRTVKNKDGKDQSVYVWQLQARVYLSYLDYANHVPKALSSTDPTKSRNTFTVNTKIELVRIPMQEDGNLVAINALVMSTAAE